jgi:NAD(P)-dependent dehydrogenase (short-subunit alcohol dehydrogenase family)
MAFDGKVAVVTGGASGIGAATSRALATKGAKVLVADVSEEAGSRVVAEIENAGGTALFHRVDVARFEDNASMVNTAVNAWGGLHLAANVAGIGQPPSRIHDMEEETWDRMLSIDLKGLWFSMKAEITHFLAAGGGSIVNVASGAGMRATIGQPAYGVAKAGVIQLSRQGALEYAKDGIRVNSVSPGLIETPAVATLPDDVRAMYAAGQPGGRMGRPEEVASTIAWLLSDDASFVSGLNHLTDGGWFQMSPS